MLLITLAVIWALTDAAPGLLYDQADVSPADPTIQNGSSITINCTLREEPQASGKTASDIMWKACPTYATALCGDVSARHRVQIASNRTSLLHLEDLVMPQREDEEGMNYLCLYEGSTWNVISSPLTKVYVGIPPGPVEDLRCFSRDMEHFTCSWTKGRYTGIATKRTYFQYRQRFVGQDSMGWNTTTLESNDLEFSGRAFQFEMEIRVTQENVLGNSTPVTTTFAAGEETVPNPPREVELTFLLEEDDAISMQVDWQLPDGWPQNALRALLEYRIDYKDSNADSFMTGSPTLLNQQSFSVGSIKPYTNYTVRVACKLNTGKGWSDWSPLLTGLSPEAAPSGGVRHLSASTQRGNINPYKRDVQLTWQPPSLEHQHGVIRGYVLRVSPSSLPQPIHVTQPSFELRDLDKFRSYEVRVAAHTVEGAVGPFVILEIPDLTTVPGKVENMGAITVTSDSVRVTWDAPFMPRGDILGYIVTREELKSTGNVHTEKLDGLTREIDIAGLQPYTEYRINVTIYNKKGDGEKVTKIVRTKFSSPTRPRNLEHHRSSPTEIKLYWDKPGAPNGPLAGYEIRYWPSGQPSKDSLNKTVSVTQATLSVNCSAYEEAVPFMFQVFACTGLDESDMLLGPPAVMEYDMCGVAIDTTAIIMGVLFTAFAVLCLLFCLNRVRHSSLMKPSPDPYFIEGILEPSSDKFNFNGRLATRRQEKEDYDTLKTCESVHVLISPGSEIASNKGSMSSSTGSSSDQGFHEMPAEIEHYGNLGIGAVTTLPHTRCSSGYGQSLLSQSEQDLQQKQRMLSMSEECTEDEDQVFDCPEDVDGGDSPGGLFVNSYQTSRSSLGTPPPSPESVHRPMGSRESIQYTSTQDSPAATEDHHMSSGSESGSISYLQLGTNMPQPQWTPRQNMARDGPLARRDPGEESDTNYSQMAMQGDTPAQTPDRGPLYDSVWPSVTSPEKLETSPDPAWMDGFHTDLGFNNNSKDIPDIHAGGLFRPPQEIIVATAFTPQTPTHPADPEAVNSSLPRLSSSGSEDYIDIIGSCSSPRANPQKLVSPTTVSPCNRGDISCQDYVMQSELPPASPPESSML